jgi:hypothetical protein
MDATTLAQIFDTLNGFLDKALLFLFLAGLVVWNSRELVLSARREIEKAQKEAEEDWEAQEVGEGEVPVALALGGEEFKLYLTGAGKALYLWLVSAAVQIVILLLFWFTPSTRWASAETLRWLLLYLLVGGMVYGMTRRFGGRRGLYSAVGHLSVLWFGWSLGRWFGLLFVSLPLIGLYFYVLNRIAEVIPPAADPEDRREWRERFKVLVWYMWGGQYPIIVVADRTGVETEMRIESSPFQDFGAPGYVLAHMHQAIGLTKGTSFSRVEGPGAILTQQYERLLEVVDLRTQLRTAEVDTITQDGVSIKAIVFAAFAIDKFAWDEAEYKRLRMANPLLRGGRVPDRGNDSYPYSRARVRAALGIEGIGSSVSGDGGFSALRWDEQVMRMVAETARRVLSEEPLSALWLPADQEQEDKLVRVGKVGALDLIAEEIQGQLADTLQENGVKLYTARVVNYFLPGESGDGVDEITRQLIPVWQTRWEQRAVQKIARAEAIAERELMDANALARSMLIESIARSLKASKTKNLPRYLVAMRFLGALDDLISQQPSLAAGEEGRLLRERLALFKTRLPKGKV